MVLKMFRQAMEKEEKPHEIRKEVYRI